MSGISGFLFSIVVAFIFEKFSDNYVANSAITVISGYLIYKIVFAILFHISNKQNYIKKVTGKINLPKFKRILFQMLFASTIFDIINNFTRFILLVQFLRLNYSVLEATVLSSLIASLLAYFTINMLVRYVRFFKSKR